MNSVFGWLLAAAQISVATQAIAGETNFEVGVSATEIKIGNLMPYSGQASMYSVIGKTEAAYFKKLNDEGGINGRKITFISYDDAQSPPKAVERTRQLVESDEVFAMFGATGSAANAATMKYLNSRSVPQLFIAAGASKFSDPKNFPWTMAWIPTYRVESAVYGKYIVDHTPDAKVAILYQNDDFGRDHLAGLEAGLGNRAGTLLVGKASYETSEPTITSMVVSLKATGADTVVIAAQSKFATQAIKTMAEQSWRPTVYISNASVGVSSVLTPAGLQNAKGFISAAYRKDPEDPAWKDDAAMREFYAFMDKYLPGEKKNDQSAFGYLSAQTLEFVLRQCGNELTRANLVKQAANLKDVQLGLLLPGIKLNTSATDYVPIKQFRLMKFSGEHWTLFGDLVTP